MSGQLMVENAKKSLSVLEDFLDAVVIDKNNQLLKEKKRMADEAVKHLYLLASPEDDEPMEGECPPEYCDQTVQRKAGKCPSTTAECNE